MVKRSVPPASAIRTVTGAPAACLTALLTDSRQQRNTADSTSGGYRLPGAMSAVTATGLAAPASSRSSATASPWSVSSIERDTADRLGEHPFGGLQLAHERVQALDRRLDPAALRVELDQPERQAPGHQVVLHAVVEVRARSGGARRPSPTPPCAASWRSRRCAPRPRGAAAPARCRSGCASTTVPRTPRCPRAAGGGRRACRRRRRAPRPACRSARRRGGWAPTAARTPRRCPTATTGRSGRTASVARP